MSLIDRLAGIGTNEGGKLGVDTFWAMMYELASGQVTKAQIVAHFALDTGEADELQTIINKYNAQPNATAKAKFVELMRVLFILAESQMPGYQTNAQLNARINAL